MRRQLEFAFMAEQIRPWTVFSVATPQPPPLPGGSEVVVHVAEDLFARSDMGFEKYGTRLTTSNGRDALMDAYQEALDLVCYLKQAIMERESET